ncbi:MAG: outer membrane lipoprotein-sorting protein [Verrucomicrobiota bacterium]
MMKASLTLLASAVALIAPLHAQNAEQILERARLGAVLQNADLHGKIRNGREKTSVSLFLRNEDIQFTTGAGEERFHMRLGNNQFDLFEIVGGKTKAFPKKKFGQAIAGSDLTYEDLSLRFLYWPNPKLEGEERVDVHNCWKIRIDNPGKSGRYSAVFVWIHQKFGAFMKIEGFDGQGNKLKQFTVEEVMKLPDKTHTVKKIQVASYANGRRSGISYLEFDKPKKGPKGLGG